MNVEEDKLRGKEDIDKSTGPLPGWSIQQAGKGKKGKEARG